MRKNLTIKQRLFIQYYLENGFNATQAALSAKYSKKTAHAIGQENLKKPIIKKEIAFRINSYLSDTEKATLKLIKSLDEMIEADIGDYVNIETEIIHEEWTDSEGKIIPAVERKHVVFNETENLNTKIISEISEGPHGMKIKMQDKLKAIELKGKYLSLWNDGVLMHQKESKKETLSKEGRRNRILELSEKLK